MFRNFLVIFFPQANVNNLPPIPCQQRAVIGRSENGQPIGMTVHSYESVSYMQGMGCNELGKGQFLINTL